MSLATAVRRWLSGSDEVLYECRHCGTTVELTDRQCPTCGSAEIAEFDPAEYEAP